MIQAQGLSIRRGGRQIVHAVSFQAEAGEWLALIGPNGAGKSTILHALAGVIPSQGRIVLAGRPWDQLNRRERARHLALVPQQPVLPQQLTVADYVSLGRTPQVGALGTEGLRDLSAVHDMLTELDLVWAATRRIDEISGGEFRRAVLARALVQGAKVLLLDEPTTGLDLGHQQRSLELVERMRHQLGLTVISVMHDLTLAAQFADRFLLACEGRIVAEGSRDEVLAPEVISRHYDAVVRQVRLEDGTIALVPIRRPGTASNGGSA